MIIYFAICIFAFYFVLTFDNIKYNNILNQNISKINIKKKFISKKKYKIKNMQNQNVINTFFSLTVKNVKRILIVFVLFVVNLAFFLNHIILIETFFYLTFFS
uniref:Uncharacterized protein n=1 Tax=Vannella croatica TaxID=1778588 RepID=A0A2I6SS18_9EUKA|nr:hypothetical protein [Vannella croatica]